MNSNLNNIPVINGEALERGSWYKETLNGFHIFEKPDGALVAVKDSDIDMIPY